MVSDNVVSDNGFQGLNPGFFLNLRNLMVQYRTPTPRVNEPVPEGLIEIHTLYWVLANEKIEFKIDDLKGAKIIRIALINY